MEKNEIITISIGGTILLMLFLIVGGFQLYENGYDEGYKDGEFYGWHEAKSQFQPCESDFGYCWSAFAQGSEKYTAVDKGRDYLIKLWRNAT